MTKETSYYICPPINEKRCDQCYNQRLSKNMALSGKIVCKNCGETICEEPIK